ncbi:hypothetical protein C8R43DRAFT_1230245 [Mycena crocata]|nr:hypothetical protein C8R43DRAFT_1230245 [Mycena crocata]
MCAGSSFHNSMAAADSGHTLCWKAIVVPCIATFIHKKRSLHIRAVLTALETHFNSTMRVAILGFAVALVGGLIPGVCADVGPPPGGYRANVTMHEVPHGGRIAHVGKDVQLLDKVDKLINAASPTGMAPSFGPPAAPRSGWITHAFWFYTAASPISSFTTTFMVPPPPATLNGQLIYLFPCMEPGTLETIMQPVLQFGTSPAGGGAFWSVASWYLLGDQIYFTPAVSVNVGQILKATMTLVSQDGTHFGYTTQFTDIPGTALTVTGAKQLSFVAEALEAYGITRESDYPPGATVFRDINIVLTNRSVPHMGWSVANDEPDGLGTSISVDGAKNGQLTIMY